MTITATPPQAQTVSNARKLILPVLAVVAIGVLALTAGIPWTNASSASEGIRLQAQPDQGAKLTISELEPGDSVTRSVTIRNSSAEESRLSFEEAADPATFAGGELQLSIEHDGQTVYSGQFGAMNDVSQDVGNLPPGGSSEFIFTVSLPDDAPFANQGSPAEASYTWVNSTAGVG